MYDLQSLLRPYTRGDTRIHWDNLIHCENILYLFKDRILGHLKVLWICWYVTVRLSVNPVNIVFLFFCYLILWINPRGLGMIVSWRIGVSISLPHLPSPSGCPASSA